MEKNQNKTRTNPHHKTHTHKNPKQTGNRDKFPPWGHQEQLALFAEPHRQMAEGAGTMTSGILTPQQFSLLGKNIHHCCYCANNIDIRNHNNGEKQGHFSESLNSPMPPI